MLTGSGMKDIEVLGRQEMKIVDCSSESLEATVGGLIEPSA